MSGGYPPAAAGRREHCGTEVWQRRGSESVSGGVSEVWQRRGSESAAPFQERRRGHCGTDTRPRTLHVRPLSEGGGGGGDGKRALCTA